MFCHKYHLDMEPCVCVLGTAIELVLLKNPLDRMKRMSSLILAEVTSLETNNQRCYDKEKGLLYKYLTMFVIVLDKY